MRLSDCLGKRLNGGNVRVASLREGSHACYLSLRTSFEFLYLDAFQP